MTRQPPSSTLFPYTTLFRSYGASSLSSSERSASQPACARRSASSAARSEEHTSELQSPYDLVCRLLLEKKKVGFYDKPLLKFERMLFTYVATFPRSFNSFRT